MHDWHGGLLVLRRRVVSCRGPFCESLILLPGSVRLVSEV